MARLTVELLRPVPLAELQAVARTIRPGKKVQWLEGALLADGVEVARATALRLCTQDVDVADAVSPPGRGATSRVRRPAPTFEFFDREYVGYWAANDIRLVHGAFGVAGPATAWLRLLCPVVAGEPVAPFERVAAAADFGSGIGNPLTFVTASAINPEVSIHTFRHPAGEWVCLESGALGRGARRRPRRHHAARRAGPARARARRRCSSARSQRRPPGFAPLAGAAQSR